MANRFWDETEKEQRTFAEAIVALVGHLVGAAIVFFTVFVLAWLLGWAFAWLNSVHPFAPEVLHLLERAETWAIYLDAGISAVVLLAGAGRFLRDIVRNMK